MMPSFWVWSEDSSKTHVAADGDVLVNAADAVEVGFHGVTEGKIIVKI
jgi:hypothetical protein